MIPHDEFQNPTTNNDNNSNHHINIIFGFLLKHNINIRNPFNQLNIDYNSLYNRHFPNLLNQQLFENSIINKFISDIKMNFSNN